MTIGALLAFSVLPLIPFVSSAQSAGPERFRLRINALADRIATSNVVKMDVLEIPAEVATRTQVTPDLLERAFDFRLTVADIRGWSDRPALIVALRSLKAEPSSGSADLRWAVIFSDPEGRRVDAIYFDGDGKNGMLGTDSVSFKGDFFAWLTRRFLPCFR